MPDETLTDVHLTIDELAPSLNGKGGLIRMHWSEYIPLRERWIWSVRELGIPSEVYPATVEIARYYAHHPLDIDNLYAAAKVPLDALRNVGWLRDDDPDALRSLRCTQHKVPTVDEQRTEITITPLP